MTTHQFKSKFHDLSAQVVAPSKTEAILILLRTYLKRLVDDCPLIDPDMFDAMRQDYIEFLNTAQYCAA